MKLFLIFSALLIGLMILGAVVAHARSVDSGPYDLSWNVIASGGGLSSGGGYLLNGTIGQPAAGQVGNPAYTLNGGFWAGAAIKYNIYLPLVLKNF